MILLDTNVVSELMRPAPSARVLQWLNHQPSREIWLSSVVAGELLFGLARLPEGARKQQLTRTLSLMLSEDFQNRVLAYDLEAAVVYADLVAQRESQGRPISLADAQIASICLTHQASLATRNTKDFEGLGLTLINPWLNH
ncbi:MAG: type II toxin-antitoxin system VapC family toxin [Betaproteobacteria bacterium]